jgi:hypothetical protein
MQASELTAEISPLHSLTLPEGILSEIAASQKLSIGSMRVARPAGTARAHG